MEPFHNNEGENCFVLPATQNVKLTHFGRKVSDKSKTTL